MIEPFSLIAGTSCIIHIFFLYAVGFYSSSIKFWPGAIEMSFAMMIFNFPIDK